MMDLPTIRREIEFRPFCVFAAGLIIGLTGRSFIGNVLFVIPVFVILTSLRLRVGLAVSLGVGLLLSPIAPQTAPPGFFSGSGNIVTQPRRIGDALGAEFSPEGQKCSVFDQTGKIEFGQRVFIEGPLTTIREGESYLVDRGVSGKIRATTVTILSDPPLPIAWSNHLRSQLVSFLERELPADLSGIVAGMCLSANETLTEDQKDALRSTGTVHLVSSSGLHVLAMTGILLLLFCRIPIPRHGQLALVTVCLVGYFVASGLHPATLRAVIMSIVAMFTYRSRRSFDLLSALSLAAMIDLIFRPTDLFEIGFQLSFLTVAAFGMFGSSSVGSMIRRYGSASVLSSVATGPLIAQRLGFMSLGSVFANVMTVFILPFVVAGTYGAFFLSAISPSVGHGLIGFVAVFAGWFMQVLQWFANEHLILPVPAFSGYWLVLFYGAMLLIWRPRVVKA